MIYEEYAALQKKYYAAQKNYEELLDKKEELFIRTQPSAIDYSKDAVAGGSTGDSFTDYISAKDKLRLDERLAEALNIMTERMILLDSKEEELRSSKDWYDVIYVCRFLDRYSISKIERTVPYSRSQIYNILQKIRTKI
ncbi:MAG: hypothetical protein MJZ37_06390 [Bacilli bacterium]|nr:hypothetical protein [Bacilli bacterium]